MRLRNKFNFEENQSVDTEGSWAVSYGDMITLLLSFFVIYFSTDFNKQVEEKLGKTVVEEIGKVRSDISFENNLLSNVALKDLPLDVGEEILTNVDIKVYKAGKSFLIRFDGVSFFDSGKVELRPEAKKVLSKIVTRIEPFLTQYKVKVRAFTDNTPVKKNSKRFKDNLELSALRAVSTMRVLEKDGIPRYRMEVAGYGEMSEALLKFLKIPSDDEVQKKAMSRSIMILLKREEYEQS